MIHLLERAVAARPADAALLSDLAAAYLATSRMDQRLLALGAASRAVEADPSLPDARFNLALALEQFGFRRQARRAWARYLRMDPYTGWAREALKHLQDLREPSPVELWTRLRKISLTPTQQPRTSTISSIQPPDRW